MQCSEEVCSSRNHALSLVPLKEKFSADPVIDERSAGRTSGKEECINGHLCTTFMKD
jgi:hypothetical protein